MEKPLGRGEFWSTVTQLPLSPYRTVGRLDAGVEEEHDCAAAAASGAGAATSSPAATRSAARMPVPRTAGRRVIALSRERTKGSLVRILRPRPPKGSWPP